MSVGVIVVTLLVSSASIQPRNLELSVTGETSAFEGAVREYQDIWRREGQRIVDAMERTTGLRFEAGPIGVVVYEGPSNSGFRERPMRLGARYSTATKRATLVHELAHRLIGELVPASFEDHPIIFLFVYDVGPNSGESRSLTNRWPSRASGEGSTTTRRLGGTP